MEIDGKPGENLPWRASKVVADAEQPLHRARRGRKAPQIGAPGRQWIIVYICLLCNRPSICSAGQAPRRRGVGDHVCYRLLTKTPPRKDGS
jgi:hypothetical protein